MNHSARDGKREISAFTKLSAAFQTQHVYEFHTILINKERSLPYAKLTGREV